MLSEGERFEAAAEWSDDEVTEIIYMLRCGYPCAYVADRFRAFDEDILRIGWALRAAGADVRGLRPLAELPITPSADRRHRPPGWAALRLLARRDSPATLGRRGRGWRLLLRRLPLRRLALR